MERLSHADLEVPTPRETAKASMAKPIAIITLVMKSIRRNYNRQLLAIKDQSVFSNGLIFNIG